MELAKQNEEAHIKTFKTFPKLDRICLGAGIQLSPFLIQEWSTRALRLVTFSPGSGKGRF